MEEFEQKVGSDIVDRIIVSNAPIYMDKEYESSTNHSKSRSKVWDVFQKIPAERDEDSKAICTYCKKVYSAKSANGTSHLRRHLESCLKWDNHDFKQDNHELQHDLRGIKRHKASLDSLTNATLSSKKYKNDLDEIRRAIAMMIVTDKQAFGMVEDMGFKSVMAIAFPEFEVMSKQTIKRDIISIYMNEREKVRKLLTSCPGRICLTSVTWKSVADDQYNCVTVHFIDHEWKLQKRILWFNLVPPPYDSLYAADEIALCMVQWNIEHKFFSIGLDNSLTNDQVTSVLRSRLDAKLNLSCNGAFFSVGCCSQVLNSIVQAGFDLISDIIGKLRLGVKYVKQSPQRKKKFYNILRNLNLDMKKKLCLDCPTRWNTVYHLLEIALHYKNAFLYMGKWDKNFEYSLSEEEWEKVNILCKFLKVFYEVTCMFFGTRYPTSNLYFKGVWKIHNRLLDAVRGPENFMTSMLAEMQGKFSKYWSENNLILSCAAILDPRYKVKFIEYCYTKLYGFEAQQHVGNIVRTLFGLFDEYVKSSVCSSCTTGISVTVSNDEEDDDFEDYKTFRSAIFRAQEEKSELDRYLEEPSYDLNSEIDVLEYWRSCSVKYPELSRMARDILTIPVSTVDPENAYSMDGRVISPYQSSLKPKTIRALVCLQDWVQTSDTTSYLESKMEDDNSSSSDDAADY